MKRAVTRNCRGRTPVYPQVTKPGILTRWPANLKVKPASEPPPTLMPEAPTRGEKTAQKEKVSHSHMTVCAQVSRAENPSPAVHCRAVKGRERGGKPDGCETLSAGAYPLRERHQTSPAAGARRPCTRLRNHPRRTPYGLPERPGGASNKTRNPVVRYPGRPRGDEARKGSR